MVILVIMVLLMMMGMQFQPPRKSQRLQMFRAGCVVQPATSKSKELASMIGSGCDAQPFRNVRAATVRRASTSLITQRPGCPMICMAADSECWCSSVTSTNQASSTPPWPQCRSRRSCRRPCWPCRRCRDQSGSPTAASSAESPWARRCRPSQSCLPSGSPCSQSCLSPLAGPTAASES